MQITPQTIKDFSWSQRFVRGVASHTMAPYIMLEAFVTGGRTVQAYKRGGFEEARERLTEESIGAFFWFCGVKAFNKMNDFIGKKVLHLLTADFDGDGDNIRKPAKNYLHDEKLVKKAAKGELPEEVISTFDERMLNHLKKLKKNAGKALKELTPKQVAVFKSLKIGSSILLANVLVGLVVPHINQSITKKLHEKRQAAHILAEEKSFMPVTMDSFMKKSDKNGNDNVAFTGINAQTLLSIANKFENDPVYQLMSTDVGIAGGRGVSARNNHERTEVLFRDISSIYFYMFNMPNINRWLNQLESGRKTRLDPVGAQQATDMLKQVLQENGGKMSVEKFSDKVLGNNNNVYKITPELNAKFKNDVITLDTFLDHISKDKALTVEEVDTYTDLAKRMAKLQPAIERETQILTKKQVKDVFREGYLNMPEFLDNVYSIATEGKHKDPYKYVSQSSLDGMKDDLYHYVNDIIKNAKKSGKEITPELLENARRMNFIKNSFNWGIGFAVSALFLSTLIPKMQYWITKVTTGHNEFPGTADYSYEKK